MTRITSFVGRKINNIEGEFLEMRTILTRNKTRTVRTVRTTRTADKSKGRTISILSTFSLYTPKPQKIFVSVTSYGIIFSTDTVSALTASSTSSTSTASTTSKQGSEDTHVNVYFNRATKQTAIKADANGKWKFSPNRYNKYIRWNDKKLIKKMRDVAGTEIEGKRFLGTYHSNENVVIFDFNLIKPIRQNRVHDSSV